MDYRLIFAQNTHLESERLILRPILMSDAEDMFEYAGDQETTEYVFPMHENLDRTKATIANLFMAEPLGKYAIEHKADGKMIGTIDLRIKEGEATGEIGYTLNKKYWGQGLMPEAAFELLALGFDKMQLVHIYATHDLRNEKSGRVMTKIGMKKVGQLQEARIFRGTLVDEVIYGISRSQWQRRVM